MDYLDALTLVRHASFAQFEALAGRGRPATGAADHQRRARALWDFAFQPGDVILVGRESAGVPDSVHALGRGADPHSDRAAAALAQRRRRRGAGARRSAPSNRRAISPTRLDVTKDLGCAMIIRLWANIEVQESMISGGIWVERHGPGAHRRRPSVGARRAARGGDRSDPRRGNPCGGGFRDPRRRARTNAGHGPGAARFEHARRARLLRPAVPALGAPRRAGDGRLRQRGPDCDAPLHRVRRQRLRAEVARRRDDARGDPQGAGRRPMDAARPRSQRAGQPRSERAGAPPVVADAAAGSTC